MQVNLALCLSGESVYLGNNDKFKGFGCVCFIDVLGFSDEIMKNWNNPNSDPLETILSIKNKMPIFETDDSDENHSNSIRSYVCRVNSISDSVTICFGYSKDIIVGDLVLGLEAVISNIAHVWSMFIEEGFTIRGAIDIGDIYWDKNELIGPSFINVYQLESKVAKTSRVVVSPNLNMNLKNLAEKHESSLTDHLFQSFSKDIDGYIIINPHILYKNNNEKSTLISRLEKMKELVPKGIVREKYTPLISMLKNENNVKLNSNDFGNY